MVTRRSGPLGLLCRTGFLLGMLLAAGAVGAAPREKTPEGEQCSQPVEERARHECCAELLDKCRLTCPPGAQGCEAFCEERHSLCEQDIASAVGAGTGAPKAGTGALAPAPRPERPVRPPRSGTEGRVR